MIKASNSNLSRAISQMLYGRYTVFIILSVNLLIRLLFYLNTTQFYGISEGSILIGVDQLKEGKELFLFSGNFCYTLSYIVYLSYLCFGNFSVFFVFQCIISTITSYIVFLIICRLAKSKSAGIIGLILITPYVDFVALSSIAYNQVMEIFFASLFLIMVLRLMRPTRMVFFLVDTLCLTLIVYLSLFFRGTLQYVGLVFFTIAIIVYFRKDGSKHIARRLVFVSFFVFIIIGLFQPVIYFSKPNNTLSNDFIFFGHTLYGGDGGEGAFVYKTNEQRYQKEFSQYQRQHLIIQPTRNDINDFQKQEIIKFIKNHPFSWCLLQVKKVIYTYGIIPIRDNITLLMTAHIKFGLFFSLVLSQITFVIPIIVLLIFFNIDSFVRLLKTGNGVVLFVFLLYLIVATSLYGHYQERYRIVVMVTTIIPLAAIFFDVNYFKKLFSDRKLLIKKLVLVLIVLLIWFFQAYEALILHGDRYFGAVEKMSGH